MLRQDKRSSVAHRGPEIATKLDGGKIEEFTEKDRYFLVKVLGRYLMKNCKRLDFPSVQEKVDMANSIILTFPFLKKTGENVLGYEDFYDRRTYKGFLENYIRQRRSRDVDIVMGPYKSKVMPAASPSATEKELITKMQRLRPAPTTKEALQDMLTKTQVIGKEWITCTKNSNITTILAKYPRLFDKTFGVISDFHFRYHWNISICDVWPKILNNLLDYGLGANIVTVDDVGDRNDYDRVTRLALHILVNCLPPIARKGVKVPRVGTEWRIQQLYMEFNNSSTVDEAIRMCEEANMQQPGLVFIGDKTYIKLDKRLSDISELPSFVHAFEYLYMSFYVFHVDFPASLSLLSINFLIM